MLCPGRGCRRKMPGQCTKGRDARVCFDAQLQAARSGLRACVFTSHQALSLCVASGGTCCRVFYAYCSNNACESSTPTAQQSHRHHPKQQQFYGRKRAGRTDRTCLANSESDQEHKVRQHFQGFGGSRAVGRELDLAGEPHQEVADDEKQAPSCPVCPPLRVPGRAHLCSAVGPGLLEICEWRCSTRLREEVPRAVKPRDRG